MAKLYFKFGTMNSSKTANALMTIHNYEEQGMKVYLIKPEIDTRDIGVVRSRALSTGRKVNRLIKDTDKITDYEILNYDVIIVDECQFLTEKQIDELRYIVDKHNIPVICYGLRTDFQSHLFEGSKRLFEIADSLTEIKTICKCGSKAIFNARINEKGNIITSGKQIEIGGNDKYRAVCSKCYGSRLVNY